MLTFEVNFGSTLGTIFGPTVGHFLEYLLRLIFLTCFQLNKVNWFLTFSKHLLTLVQLSKLTLVQLWDLFLGSNFGSTFGTILKLTFLTFFKLLKLTLEVNFGSTLGPYFGVNCWSMCLTVF